MTSAENSVSEPPNLTWPQTPYKTCAFSTRDNAFPASPAPPPPTLNPSSIKKSLATALKKAYVKQSQYAIGAASSLETCLFFSILAYSKSLF